MSDPRNTQHRFEWMPNRMFDPATNPFAIQNLLKEEEKKDTFLLKRDERPVFDYADNPLLKEVNIQPAADFHYDELLDQPVSTSSVFQSGSDDQSSSSSISDDTSTEITDEQTISAESVEASSHDDEVDSTSSDDELTTETSLEASGSEDSVTDHPEEILQSNLADSLIDAIVEERLTEGQTQDQVQAQAQSHDHEVSQGLDESVQEPVAEQVADDLADHVLEATDNNAQMPIETESPVEQSSEEAEQATELRAPEDDIDLGVTQPERQQTISTETESGSTPDSEAAPGLDNEAVTQLIEAAREEARAEAHAAGFQEGLAAGIEQAKADLQAGFDEKLAVLDQMIQGVHQLERDPNALFEPMKKLAMHLAQQLVRGELTQSPQVIARLVDNCLRELASSGEKSVIVHLNPEDLEQYKPLTAQFGDSLVLRPDALLSRGSVRASLDGSVVEDLIERRTKGLTKSLSQPIAAGWRPALASPSGKPQQSTVNKPAAATTPATPANSAAQVEAVEALDHDTDDDHFSNDDVLSDDSSIDDMNDSNTDRNGETHS